MYILSWLKGQFWNVNFTRAQRILAEMEKKSWPPHHTSTWRDETFDEILVIHHSIIFPQSPPTFTCFQTRELANRFAAAEDALHSLQVMLWCTDVLKHCTDVLNWCTALVHWCTKALYWCTQLIHCSDVLMYWCTALMHCCLKVEMYWCIDAMPWCTDAQKYWMH